MRRGNAPSVPPLVASDDLSHSQCVGTVKLSHFVAVGNNLSRARCPNNTLAGVLLSHLPQVLLERRCLMIEGRATLGGIGVLYRSALYPLSDDGVAIDHVLGAANYRPLRENEELIAPLIRTKWL
jgi:hypothetical protein